MSSFTFLGKNRIYFGTAATLIEHERELASDWAASHILLNPAHAWVLGKFVESDRANKNQQVFSLDGLQLAKPTIAHAPLNINHNPRNVIGAFVSSEMIYPTGESANDADLNPYIESLAVLWKYYFQDEYRAIQKASGEEGLFFSMECIPRALSTIGGSDDAKEYPYEGRQSPSYPSEMNERAVPIMLHDPHFVGGALVIAPEKPAWNRADVQQVSQYLASQWQEAELGYEGIKAAAPGLDVQLWESMMAQLILQDAKN